MIKFIENGKEWNSLLENMDVVDFHHTHEYHCLDKNDADKPLLISYTDQNSGIALPLLVRKIEGTNFYDATSVTGYSGPVTRNIDDGFDNKDFKEHLERAFKERNIVSVFTRLNPFISHQEACLTKMGKIETLGNIVSINLNRPLGMQRLDYQKRLKTYINKSRRFCTVQIDNTPRGLVEFIKIYKETMLRLKAAPRYFFPESYFKGLLASKTFKTEVWLARENKTGHIVAGALFVKKEHLIHYHLSGANPEFSHLNAIKLIIDEVRIQATKENFSILNLGGGVGSQDDSLYRFKKSFSKDVESFKAWKYIIDQKVYDDLIARNQKNSCVFIDTDCQRFFPCYRCSLYEAASQHPMKQGMQTR